MNWAHGVSHIKTLNHIIYITLEGDFNGDGVIIWIEKVKRIVTDFNGEKFAILMDLTRTTGATPEGFEHSNQYNLWLNNQNLIGKALLYPSDALKNIEKLLVTNKDNQNIQNFDGLDGLEQAEKWLLSLF